MIPFKPITPIVIPVIPRPIAPNTNPTSNTNLPHPVMSKPKLTVGDAIAVPMTPDIKSLQHKAEARNAPAVEETNWYLVGGVAAGVLLLIVLIIIWIRRNKKKKEGGK